MRTFYLKTENQKQFNNHKLDKHIRTKKIALDKLIYTEIARPQFTINLAIKLNLQEVKVHQCVQDLSC